MFERKTNRPGIDNRLPWQFEAFAALEQPQRIAPQKINVVQLEFPPAFRHHAPFDNLVATSGNQGRWSANPPASRESRAFQHQFRTPSRLPLVDQQEWNPQNHPAFAIL
jgi:hypothetical protein